MDLITASDSDSQELMHFFSGHPTSGHVSFSQTRGDDFFAPYRSISEDFTTLFMRDKNGEIVALATLVFKKGFLNNEEQVIAIAKDLRVAHNRLAIRAWPQVFIPKIEEEMTKRNCKYTFSKIELFENQTYNALLRPRNFRRKLPRYYLFRKYDRVFVHGIWPWAEAPISTLKFESGKTEDIPEISSYLLQKAIHKPINFPATIERIEHRLKTWTGFNISNFIIARNSRGGIVGVTAPWNLHQTQQISVNSYNGLAQGVVQTINNLSWVGITKPLPKIGSSADINHLTHLAFDNPDIFYGLVYESYYRSEKKQMICYDHYYGNFESRPPKGMITSRVPYGLFTVLPASMELPDFLRPNPFVPPPDFPSYFF